MSEHYGSIIYQDIDFPKAPAGLFHHRLDLRGIGNITDYGQYLAVFGSYLFRSLFEYLLGGSANDNIGLFGVKTLGYGLADSPSASGNECYMSFQTLALHTPFLLSSTEV
jgi:hypothetical protein